MARRVGVWSEGALGAALRLLILVGLPLAGCDTSLAVPDPGTEGSTEDVSSGLPSRSDTEGASSEPGATVNACGGETELRWEGEPALLLSPCGASGEGVLVCAGLNVLRCLGEATGTNACGGRGVLVAEPGAPCGVCAGEEGSGTWICDATAEAGVRCEGARAPNVCGGCALLTGRPGASCTDSAGEPGRWACSSADALVCAAEAENACGGSGTLRHEGEVALPGDACERPCGRGVLQCTSAESLGCASTGEEAGTNACDGCGSLAGEPEEACGPCGEGVWVCDGGGLRCEGGRLPNACGGCDGRTGTPGEVCGSGRIWRCDGPLLECAVPLEPGERNACGGAVDLFGAPGEVCGACDLGVNRCAGANRLECSQGDEPPEGWCGCSGPYIENAPCGTCGSGQVACRDGQLSCDGDAGPEGRNACGGCGDLPAEPGGTCGTCLAWACGSSGVLRCEPDSSLEGCGSVVSCDELDPPCEELVRSCIESDGEVGARCGDCRRGFVEVDGACVEEGPAPVTCAALAAECAEEGRNCVEGGDGEDARCGGCLEGYVSEGGGCRLLLTCAALDCSGQNRACDERGELEDAVCGDCLPGFEGSGDACVMPPLECERDEDCASGLQCRSGTCVTAEPQCTDVADCDPGEVCVFGQCELEPDCMVDDDCGLDERCTGQQCECTGQGTRSLGQACTSSTQCCSGVCFGAAGMGTCSRPCQAMSDCQEPGMAVHLICGSLPGLGQYCAPADFGSPCNEPGQCSGGICMDRFIGGTTPDRACTWACTQSSDCPSGATCGQLATNTGFILACIPVGEVCEGGNNGLDCFSGLCLDSTNPDLPAVCTSECRPEQELPCGQGWECVLIDPAFPPVCIPPGY